jgi:oligosaccharyl transferase complex subunit OST4
MITDSQLYSLALFLGSASVLLIVLYHFLQVNAIDEPADTTPEKEKAAKS